MKENLGIKQRGMGKASYVIYVWHHANTEIVDVEDLKEKDQYVSYLLPFCLDYCCGNIMCLVF